MFEDEFAVRPVGPQRAAVATPPLDTWGVDELRAYVEALRDEIARAEAQMARKASHRDSADAFFRRPGRDG